MELTKEKLMVEVADMEFEKINVARNQGEALSMFTYRATAKPGVNLKLTDGQDVVVIDNHPEDCAMIVAIPFMGSYYDVRMKVCVIPYMIVDTNTGVLIDYEEYMRVEGKGMCHHLIERKDWVNAAQLLNTLYELSIDISEFSQYLADIYVGATDGGAKEDEHAKNLSFIFQQVEANKGSRDE